MRKVGFKFALAASMTLVATGTAFAAFWNCVPEIDGAAGISALAALVSVAMIAHHKLTR